MLTLNKPGRPTPKDEELTERRDELVHLLSVWWADIAWQLEHAATTEDLRKAFEPLSGKGRDHLISDFVKISTLKTNGKEVRFTRRTYGKTVIPRLVEARKKHEAVSQLHSQIKLAIPLAGPEQLPVLAADLAKYEADLAVAAEKLKDANSQELELKAKLELLEASFAQAELASIIFQERCARNPLRLANAMAGLPVLSARVSYQRCSKIKCGSWPQFQFRVVKFIQSTWNRRYRYPGLHTVALFDQEIKRLSKTVKQEELPDAIARSEKGNRIGNHLRSYLGENRRFLRLAIERSLSTPNVDQRRAPLMIASNFLMILGEPRTALTLALAEHERIDR